MDCVGHRLINGDPCFPALLRIASSGGEHFGNQTAAYRKNRFYQPLRENKMRSMLVNTILHVTFIRMLCTKPMNKIPGALKDYGITADELWQRISALTGIKE